MEDKKNNAFKGNCLDNIKSIYILQQIFEYLKENKSLQIVKYNKNIQKRLNKYINNYKKYEQVIIELTSINISNKNYFIKYQE